MATKAEPIRKLRDFFADSFTVSKLEMFLTVNGYRQVADAVNSNVNLVDYCYKVTLELDRQGLIDDAFFVRLSEEHIAKAEVIRGLQESWLVEAKTSEKRRGSATSASRPAMMPGESSVPGQTTPVAPERPVKPRYRLLISQVRVGFVFLLILLDLAFALPILLMDLMPYQAHGLSLRAAAWVAISRLGAGDLAFSVLAFAAAFLLPAALMGTATVVLRRSKNPAVKSVTRRSVPAIWFHTAFAASLAVYLLLPRAMERISGYTIDLGQAATPATTEFHSKIGPIVACVSVIAVALVACVILHQFGIERIGKLMSSQPLRKYATRLALADLKGEYSPIHAARIVNLNCGSSAPELRCIRREAGRIFRNYQQRIPGSKKASNYLEQIYEASVEDLRAILMEVGSRSDPIITLLPGTSRAVEVALLRAFKSERNEIRRITLSPLEHGTIQGFASWLKHASDVIVEDLGDPAHQRWQFGDRFYRAGYDEKVKTLTSVIADEIASSFKSPGTGSETLLISEFCWRTGLIAPVSQIQQAVAEQLTANQRERFKVVVDAAHFFPQPGAGEGLAHLDEFEAYVLSGHKWLLSPEPCGILVTHRRHGARDPLPFDAWNGGIPNSTASARMLAGLKASLEVVRGIGLPAYYRRCSDLRHMFLYGVRDRFRLVDAGAGGYPVDTTKYLESLCAIEPHESYRWEERGFDVLRKQLEHQDVNAEILDVDPENPWLRVSFPFFLEEVHIGDACQKLSGLVRRRN